MPSNRRRDPIPRRRRHDDDGEEDGSTAGDLQDYASSEGSLNTDVDEDGDVSIASGDDEAQSIPSPALDKQSLPQHADHESSFKTTAETEAMLHGLHIQDGEVVEQVNFEDAVPSEEYTSPSRTQHNIRPRNRPQFGSMGKQVSQNASVSGRGSVAQDGRRGPGDNMSAGPRGRGRGFVGHNARGCVYLKFARGNY